jgi:3-deoxy-D-manno-octulosonic-acid transferase
LLLANTREGEELMFLSALRSAAQAIWQEGLLVLLVPRHPQRFNDVEKLVQSEGFAYLRRSGDLGLDALRGRLDQNVQIVLGDSLGEMAAYYGAADLAVMGGSFQKLGGHNLIESCACNCPVILGPHMFNFELASEEAVSSGAAWSVGSAEEAIQKALQLLVQGSSTIQAARAACTVFSQRHRGATLRTLAALAKVLP